MKPVVIGFLLLAPAVSGCLLDSGSTSDEACCASRSAPTITDLPFAVQLGKDLLGAPSGGSDSVLAAGLDASGNFYFIGHTTGALGEANAGGSDVYVLKLTASGALAWIRQLGAVSHGPSASGDQLVRGGFVDPSGNTYAVGVTEGSFGETEGGGNDLFVVKIDANGAVQWTRQLGSVSLGAAASAGDVANAVTADASGNVYFCGMTAGALDETHGGGSGDVFLGKLNASGALQWLTQLGASTGGAGSSGDDACRGVAVDGSGAPHIAGQTSGDLGEPKGNASSLDPFVASFTSAGTLNWIRQYGAITGGTAAGGRDEVSALAVDAAGNAYVAGATTGSLFEPHAAGLDGFVWKVTSTGTHGWGLQLGATTLGASAAGRDLLYSIAIDGSGDLLLGGDTGGSLAETLVGGANAFAAKVSPAGTLTWIRQFGAATVGAQAGAEAIASVLADTSGNIFLGGITRGNFDQLNRNYPGTGHDPLLLKLDSTGAPTAF